MKKVAIIGGGVIGLSSAWYLAKEGYEVEVIDGSDMEDGCSYGNAGMIVPSHVIPLAQPGMISQGFRWMFDRKSPFYVHPRLSKDLLSWGWQFYRHATKEHVNQSKRALLELSMLSKELYLEHAKAGSFVWTDPGLFMLYQTEKTGHEEREAAEVARDLGLEVDFLSGEDFRRMESGVKTEVLGAVHYKSDALLNPRLFMDYLKAELRGMNVQIHASTQVTGFHTQGKHVKRVETSIGKVEADEFVLCAGAWTPQLAAQLGIKVRILPGKGYSFTRDRAEGYPTLPSILCEGKVAVSPYENQVRFGGTMEITKVGDHRIDVRRVQGITDTMRRFYPEMNFANPVASEIWHGFRPCTPTGLPLISKSASHPNLTVASGHAMMGLSLAPATGKLVSELISGQRPTIDITRFGL